MSERVVICDFCSAPLSDEAWDFPADDVDYGEPRIGPNTPEPVEGAVGAWIACPACARLVRHSQRDKLAKRSFRCLERKSPEWVALGGGRAETMRSIRRVHDLFWSARRGEPTRIGADQIALIATDEPFLRSSRKRQ